MCKTNKVHIQLRCATFAFYASMMQSTVHLHLLCIASSMIVQRLYIEDVKEIARNRSSYYSYARALRMLLCIMQVHYAKHLMHNTLAPFVLVSYGQSAVQMQRTLSAKVHVERTKSLVHLCFAPAVPCGAQKLTPCKLYVHLCTVGTPCKEDVKHCAKDEVINEVNGINGVNRVE